MKKESKKAARKGAEYVVTIRQKAEGPEAVKEAIAEAKNHRGSPLYILQGNSGCGQAVQTLDRCISR